MKRSKHVSFYDRSFLSRASQNVVDGLVSAAVLYMLQPILLKALAPYVPPAAPEAAPENPNVIGN